MDHVGKKAQAVPFVLLFLVLVSIGVGGGTTARRQSALRQSLVMPPHWWLDPFDNGQQCDLCVSVLTALGKLATLNATQEAIINYVGNLCTYLPLELQTECQQMVRLGSPAVITFLLAEIGPLALCQNINLCNSTFPPAPTPSPVNPTPPSDRCVICEFLVSTLQGLLASQEVENEFLQACTAACKYLPANEQQPCHDLITQYGPTAIEVVLKFATPASVCQEVQLC